MGQWVIEIHGTGCHHNFRKDVTDANRQAACFVQQLRDAGHVVTGATFTFGGEESIVDPEKYAETAAKIEADYEKKTEVKRETIK